MIRSMDRRRVLSIPSGGGGVTPEYQAVLDYATTQGYTLPSEVQKVLQNKLVIDLIAEGIWAKEDAIYVMLGGGSSEFAAINWKTPDKYYLILNQAGNYDDLKGYHSNTLRTAIFDTTVPNLNYSLNSNSVCSKRLSEGGVETSLSYFAGARLNPTGTGGMVSGFRAGSIPSELRASNSNVVETEHNNFTGVSSLTMVSRDVSSEFSTYLNENPVPDISIEVANEVPQSLRIIANAAPLLFSQFFSIGNVDGSKYMVYSGLINNYTADVVLTTAQVDTYLIDESNGNTGLYTNGNIIDLSEGNVRSSNSDLAVVLLQSQGKTVITRNW